MIMDIRTCAAVVLYLKIFSIVEKGIVINFYLNSEGIVDGTICSEVVKVIRGQSANVSGYLEEIVVEIRGSILVRTVHNANSG